ncbi:hypothetical protein ACRAKI_23520 [Saccharothrix isguenensis]
MIAPQQLLDVQRFVRDEPVGRGPATPDGLPLPVDVRVADTGLMNCRRTAGEGVK